MNTTSLIDAFDAENGVRSYEPMQRKQRRPEPRRKSHGGSTGGGMHCRRNKHHTWGSGAGARLADLRAFAGAVALAMIAMVSSASAIDGPFTYTNVGNPGNAAVPQSGLGAVAYNFKISAYETTNSQYATFLNTSNAGKTNANGIWNSQMATRGITQNGTAGNYTYSVTSGFANRPVVAVNWFSAARFVNWYANGATPSASLETGSYTLNNATSGNIAPRNAGAQIFLPSADEWTKAAFYDAVSTSYKLYPTGSNAVPTATQVNVTAPNTANFVTAPTPNPTMMAVGSYVNTQSTYGAFDMLGNAKEITDTSTPATAGRYFSMGGSAATYDLAPWMSTYSTPALNAVLTDSITPQIGFRVAAVPEPSNMVAAALGLGGLIAVHMVKRRKPALARVAG